MGDPYMGHKLGLLSLSDLVEALRSSNLAPRPPNLALKTPNLAPRGPNLTSRVLNLAPRSPKLAAIAFNLAPRAPNLALGTSKLIPDPQIWLTEPPARLPKLQTLP